MKVSGYLIVTPKSTGSNFYPRKGADVRFAKTKPKLKAKEIAFNMDIDLPDALWERYIPTVELVVPTEAILNPDQSVAVNMVSNKVAEALKLEVKTVEDGLINMLKEQSEQEH